MVRDDYRLRTGHPAVAVFPPAPDPTGADPEPEPEDERAPHLGGSRRLPATHVIEWERFFYETRIREFSNPSLRINTGLSARLKAVPPDGLLLARRNLERGRALGLPAGADIAHAMGIEPLSDDDLNVDDQVTPVTRAAILRATPLWWYVLCEAGTTEHGDGGKHLGPVAGRIVAEVLVGLVEADPQSYLRQWPGWRPELPARTAGDFTMLDLVQFATGADPDAAPAAGGDA
jgi:hypothetical protein